jgi:hypothetical protein
MNFTPCSLYQKIKLSAIEAEALQYFEQLYSC